MSDSELEAKFREQAGSVIIAADVDALLKAVWALDEAGSPEALLAWTAASEGTGRPGEEIPVAD